MDSWQPPEAFCWSHAAVSLQLTPAASNEALRFGVSTHQMGAYSALPQVAAGAAVWVAQLLCLTRSSAAIPLHPSAALHALRSSGRSR